MRQTIHPNQGDQRAGLVLEPEPLEAIADQSDSRVTDKDRL